MKTLFSLVSYMKLYLCLLLLMGIIVGCTSLEVRLRASECKARNSHSDGYYDAMSGRMDSYFHVYNNKCEQYGVSLNQNLYVKGYTKGIKAFCTYKGGYQFGLKAKQYKNSCNIKKEEFLKGYEEGDQQCLYEAGYNDAVEGRKDSYTNSRCLKLSPKLNQKQYTKGRRAGLKVFCTYKSGYQWGLKRLAYNKTCPTKKRASFLKGYRAGDRKCLYDTGYNDAINGKINSYAQSSCLKLSPKFSSKQYAQGRRAGLKVFCTYKSGYQFGLSGAHYYNTCPKNTENKFFQGYTTGKKEYVEEKRHQEKLQMERERIAAERERAAAERAKAQALRDQAEAEWAKARAIEEQTDVMHDQKKFEGYQLCHYNSDCHSGGQCVYISAIGEYACRY